MRRLLMFSKETEAAMSFKSYGTLVLIVALCLVPAGIYAQELGDIICINQYYHNWQAGVSDVGVSGDYAYLACDEEGLRIIDMSDRAAFVEAGHMAYSNARVLTVTGHYLYLGCDFEGVRILDITEPESPQEIGLVPCLGYLQAIVTAGDYAYICTLSDGLIIADISDPAAPVVTWDSPGISAAYDVDVQDNFAYLSVSYTGLLAIDISDPAAPVIIDNYVPSYNDEINGVAVAGNYAYLASGWTGFEVVDLTTMELVASIPELQYSFKVETIGDYAYLSYGDPECPLAVIDITDPLAPQTLGIYYPPQDLVNFTIVDDLAYIADLEHCLRVVDIADPADPHEIYAYDRYGHDFHVTVVGDYAYVDEDCKLKVINIADMQQPYEVGYYPTSWQKTELQVAGDVGFIAKSQNPCLIAIDLTDPDPPNILGAYYEDEYNPHDILVIHDHYAYLDHPGGLQIIDVGDPENMQAVGSVSESAGVRSIEISGGNIFYQNYNRDLRVLDLADPLNPVQIASYRVNDYLRDLKCADGRLYAMSYDELFVFDITDFDQWAPLASVDLFGDNRSLMDIDANGNYLYVADFQFGLSVFDFTDVSAPQLLGDYQTPGQANGVCLVGDIAIVADETNLGFYDCSPIITGIADNRPVLPQSFALLPNYPNPFNSSTNIQFELPAPGHLTLMIFDVLGRNVGTLADGEFAAGRHIINWDGRDAQGQPVASGRYYIRAKAEDAVQTAPMLLLK